MTDLPLLSQNIHGFSSQQIGSLTLNEEVSI